MPLESSIIARLRRMVAEPTDSNGYTVDALTEVIERYPLVDAAGLSSGDDGWVPTHDLNAAAHEIWTEKAGSRSENMNFSADGGRFDHRDQYDNALKMAKHYGARRAPGSIKVSN